MTDLLMNDSFHHKCLIEMEISFTEDDYRASEAPADGAAMSFMPVRVTKSSRIANPIVLDVIPLTVDMARASIPTALPDYNIISADNPISPPFAGKTNITLYCSIFNH